MNKDLLKKMKLERGGETPYNKVIGEFSQKETKNWTDLLIVFKYLIMCRFYYFLRLLF